MRARHQLGARLSGRDAHAVGHRDQPQPEPSSMISRQPGRTLSPGSTWATWPNFMINSAPGAGLIPKQGDYIWRMARAPRSSSDPKTSPTPTITPKITTNPGEPTNQANNRPTAATAARANSATIDLTADGSFDVPSRHQSRPRSGRRTAARAIPSPQLHPLLHPLRELRAQLLDLSFQVLSLLLLRDPHLLDHPGGHGSGDEAEDGDPPNTAPPRPTGQCLSSESGHRSRPSSSSLLPTSRHRRTW